MHYFISTYFYDKEECPMRKQLKDDFVKRYPWVIILEQSGSSSFVDYILINKFLKTIDKEKCDSITLIDCDVLLPYNFKSLVEESMKKNDVSHNCKRMHEINKNEILYSIDSASFSSQGFTGLSWSFSGTFLGAINYTFPEDFKFGGLDFLFSSLYIRRKPEEFFKEQLGKKTYKKMFESFHRRTKNFIGTTLDTELITFWHGDRHCRIIPLQYYRDLTDDLLKEIMKRRNASWSKWDPEWEP